MYHSTPRLSTHMRLFMYSLDTHRKAKFIEENKQVKFADTQTFNMKALQIRLWVRVASKH